MWEEKKSPGGEVIQNPALEEPEKRAEKHS